MSHMDARSGAYRYAAVSRNDPFSADMIGVDRCAPAYRIERVNSPISVVGYTLRGSGSITQNGVSEQVNEGGLFIVQLGEQHEYHPLGEWEFCWVNIVGDFWKQLLSRYGLTRQIVYPACELGEELYRLVLFSTSGSVSSQDVQAAVQPFLLQLALHLYHRAAAQPAAELPEQIRAALDRNLFTGLSQKEICREIGLSVRHAQRLFKQAYQQTPHQYTSHRRMAAAKSLLKSTGRSIGEIACELGFSSEKHFSAAFRLLEGLPPSEYRKR